MSQRISQLDQLIDALTRGESIKLKELDDPELAGLVDTARHLRTLRDAARREPDYAVLAARMARAVPPEQSSGVGTGGASPTLPPSANEHRAEREPAILPGLYQPGGGRGRRRWLRHAAEMLGAAAILVVVTGLLVSVLGGQGGPDAPAMAERPRMTLGEGLQQTADLVSKTVAATAQHLAVAPAASNPDITLADQLPTHRGLSDHSDPVRYPNYNDCDSWRHLFDDGWNATYRMEITLRAEGDGRALLQATKEFWERQGHTVTEYRRASSSGRGLSIDTGYAKFHLDVSEERREASISGTTRCLPPR